MIQKINTQEFEAVKQDAVAIIDFSATWCGPCKMLAPVIEELSEDMKDEAKFYAVDVDEAQELAMQFGVMSVPTVLVLKNGEVAGKSVGFQPKPALEQAIRSYMG